MTVRQTGPARGPQKRRQKRRDKKKQSCPARGKRFSPAMRREILEFANSNTPVAAAQKYDVSVTSISLWKKAGLTEGVPESEVTSSAVQRDESILAIWREHPGFGPSQVRNMLRRDGVKVGVSTVRQVMIENGYRPPRAKRREHVGCYEAARPRELYHLDFVHFFVHKQRQCLLFIQDDFSRFIAGWSLVEVEAADPVVICFERAVERYGKPEGVMSDRGSAFHSWRGLSRFQALLEEYEVNFFLAKEAAVNGKVEALNAAFQKECHRVQEFTDLTDAARVIGRWVDHFNHQRTHHALGGLLVPADRFYGLEERTLKLIEEGQGAHALDILNPDNRGLELFRVVSHSGKPEVWLMGRKILG